MKKCKGILALLLSVMITVTFTPSIAFAGNGDDGNPGTYVAKIGDTNYESLQAALEAANEADNVTVQLLDDVDFRDAFGSNNRYPIEKSMTIDGDGHTITVAQRGFGVGMNASSNVDVTFKNVTINNSTAGARCIDTRGHIGTLTLDKATLNTAGASGTTQPLTIGGNQSASANIVIKNGSLIQTNDDATEYYAIITFNPVDMTITDSTIKGWSCIYAKGPDGSAGSAGSTFTITDSKLVSKNVLSGESNAFSMFTAEDNNVTFNVTGSEIDVTATGDQYHAIIAANSNALSNVKANLGEGNVVTLTGENAVFAFNNGDVEVTGGIFNKNPSDYCAEGFVPEAKEDGTYAVVTEPAVAKIGETEFASLQKAINAAHEMTGEVTITLLDSITEVAVVHQKAGLNLTIDGDGKTITGQIYIDGDGRYEGEDTLTIKNTKFAYDAATYDDAFIDVPSTKTAGKIYTTGKYNYAHNITVEDCEFTGEGTTTVAFRVASGAGAKDVTLKNNTVAGGHSFAQLVGVKNLNITGNTVTGVKNGINISGGDGTAAITGNTVTADADEGYTIRFKDANSSTATLEDNTLSGGEGIINNSTAGATVTINSGTYTGPLTTSGSGTITVTGGTFSEKVPKNDIAEGYECVKSGDVYVVQKKAPVATIGETEYLSLQEAVAAAENGDVIKVIADITVDAADSPITVPAGKDITLDLNGHKVSMNKEEAAASVLLANNGTLTINDSVGTGEMYASADEPWIYSEENPGGYANDLISNRGTLTVNGGKLYNAGEGSACYAIDNFGSGKVTINGGTIDAAKSSAIRMFYNSNGEITVNDGTIGHYNSEDDCSYMGIQVQAGTVTATLNGGTVDGEYSFYTGGGGTYSITGGEYPRYVGFTGSLTGDQVDISGGTFYEWVGSFGDAKIISGGTFADDVNEYCKDGFICVPDKEHDDMYIVKEGEFVAQVGDQMFETFEEAVEAAGGTETITLLASYSGTYKMSVGQTLIVDKNGFTFNKPTVDGAYVVADAHTGTVYTYTTKAAEFELTRPNGSVSYMVYSSSMFGNAGTYKLLKDVTATARIVPGTLASPMTIDLNGHTLTSTATDYGVYLGRGGTENTHKVFSIIDSSEDKGGQFVVNPEANAAIMVNYSSSASSNAKYNDVFIGEGVTINGGCVALLSENDTLTVNGTINGGDDFAVVTNGGTTKNATININEGAVLTSNGTAVYLPGTGTTTISGGTITGTTAIYQKSGELNITGGTITGNGEKKDYTYNDNGCNATGDAIVIDNCGYPGGEPVTSITGGTFISENASPVGSYAYPTEGDDARTPIGGVISGGKFSNNDIVKDILVEGKTLRKADDDYYVVVNEVTVTFDSDGGSAVEPQIIASGDKAVEPEAPTKDNAVFRGWFKGDTKYDFDTAVTENITLKAHWADVVAVIGDKQFASLGEAVEAAKAGDTITVVKNIDIAAGEEVVIDKKLTLDLNGKTINHVAEYTNDAYVDLIDVTGTGDLTITGNGTINGVANGNVCDGKAIIDVDGGKLTVLNGTITATGEGSDGMYGVYVLKGGTAVFGTENGGPEITSHFAAIGTNNTTKPATITVNGGTYTANAVPTNNEWWSYFCAPIYAASSGDYTIKGGTFNGYYGISTRYANVEQTLSIEGGTFNASSDTDIFVDVQTGSAGEADRRIESYTDELTVPEGYAWAKEGDVYVLQTPLDLAKAAAIAELDEVDVDAYIESHQYKVHRLIEAAKKNVEGAESIDEVNDIMAAFKSDLANYTTLAAAKEEAKTELANYKKDDVADSDARDAIVEEGSQAIDDAVTANAVNKALADAKEAIDALPTKAKKALEDAIAEATEALGADEYTAESVGAVEAAIAEAQEVLADNEATTRQYNKAREAIESAVEALVTQAEADAAAAKAEAKKALSDLIEEAKAKEEGDYTAASWAEAGLAEAIATAEAVLADEESDKADYEAAETALQEQLDKLITTKAGAKKALEDAIAAANEALGADEYTAESAAAVEAAIAEAQEVLDDNEATARQYNKAKEAIESAVEALVTQAEADAQALAEDKAKAKEALEAYKDPADYRDAEQAALAEAVAAGISAIDAATTPEGVIAALADAKEAIDALKTAAEYAAEEAEEAAQALAQAKADAKGELADYKDPADYRDAEQAALASAITNGNSAIDNASTPEEVAAALAEAKAQIDELKTAAEYAAEEAEAAAQALADAKEAANEALDSIISEENLAKYREEEQQTILGIVEAAKAAVEDATTPEEVAQILNDVAADIKDIPKDEEYDKTLEEARNAAIAAIDAKLADAQDKISDADKDAAKLASMSAKIDVLTSATPAKVDEAVQNFNQIIDEMIAAKEAADRALAEAKEKANATLDSYVTDENLAKYRDAEKQTIKDIVANAKAAVDAATTPEDVNKALSDAQKAISAVKTDEELTNEEKAAEKPADPTKQMGSDGTALGKGASAAAAEKAITSMKNDKDPAGSVFGVLKLRSTKQGKTSANLKWSKAKGAVKYVLYGNKCGKANKMKKLATTKSNKYTVKKAVKKLAKGKNYKFILVALDKNNNVVSTSKVIHVATAGTKLGNYKSVKVTKKVIANAKKIKKGKTLKLGAKAVPVAKKKVAKHVGLRYETTSKKIATVSSKGKIKAVNKGTCYVYAYAQNGVFKKIKVTVK